MKKVLFHLSTISLLILAFFALLFLGNGYELPQFTGSYVNEFKGWDLQIDDKLEYKNIVLPFYFKYDGSEKYTLVKKIDYNPINDNSPYAFIDYNHMYTKVFLDNKEIYNYTKENTPSYSKSPGNIYAAIPLTKDCLGKEMRIEFYPTLESGLSYSLPEILFGDYATVMHNVFLENLLHNIIIISILLLGLVLIVLSFAVLKNRLSNQIWYISIFAIIFAIYSITENKFNLYMLSNPYLAYLINFIVFAAIPIPLLLFYRNKVNKAFNKTYIGVTLLLAVNFFVQILLHFSHIKDIRQMLIFTHILYAVSFVLIFISIITLKSGVNKKHLILGIIPVILGLSLDAVNHYFHFRLSPSNTFFMQVGVLAFLIIEANEVLRSILSTYKQSIKSKFYKKLAYRDGLTGVYNRVAFNEEVEKIKQSYKTNDKIICVCVDINNLKVVNDKDGHHTGDILIKNTAECLDVHLNKYGKVFRTGGDEFIVFLYNICEDTFLKEIDRMIKHLQVFNLDTNVKVNFALGYEILKNNNVEECIKIADQKMYNMKNEIRCARST